MKCLETRRRGPLVKWRRYRDEHGARHTTLEVPEEVLSVLGAKRLAEELERALRAAERRVRDAKIAAALKAGTKPDAVAHEFGMSAAMIRRKRAKLRS